MATFLVVRELHPNIKLSARDQKQAVCIAVRLWDDVAEVRTNDIYASL